MGLHTVHRVARVGHNLVTKPPPPPQVILMLIEVGEPLLLSSALSLGITPAALVSPEN